MAKKNAIPNLEENQVIDVEEKCSTDISDQKTHTDHEYIPQNRVVKVYLYKQTMPDGVTVRIIQTLDKPLDFGKHQEFVKTLNEIREQIFGADGALYKTELVEKYPEDQVNITIFMIKIHSITGEYLGKVAYTPAEANRAISKNSYQSQTAKNIVKSSDDDGSYRPFTGLKNKLITKQKEVASN